MRTQTIAVQTTARTGRATDTGTAMTATNGLTCKGGKLLALLGALALVLGACGGGATTVRQDDRAAGGGGRTATAATGGGAADATAAGGEAGGTAGGGTADRRPSLSDDEFTVKTVEEVKAPDYLKKVSKESQDVFRAGVKMAVSSPPDYAGAADKFREVIASEPKFLEAYFNLGMSLERQGQQEKALRVYQDALGAFPDDVSARAYITKIYLGKARENELLGDQAQAQKWLGKAKAELDSLVAKDPKNTEVNNAMALYFLMQNDADTAETYVKEVLYQDPTNVTGLNTRGLINLKRGKYLIAEWIFKNKVLIQDPNSTEALTNLGYTYIILEKRPLAMKHFKQALELAPDNMEVRMNIAAMLLEHLNYEEAHGHYEMVRKAQPLNMEAYEGLCDAAYGMGGGAADAKAQFLAAIECYKGFMETTQANFHLHKRIAETFQQKLEDLDNAVVHYEQYAKLGNLADAEKKQIAGTVTVLKDIIAKGGLKAMMQEQAEPEPIDEDGDGLNDWTGEPMPEPEGAEEGMDGDGMDEESEAPAPAEEPEGDAVE